MIVRYSRRAQGNIGAIYNYLDEQAPAAARKVKDLIERRIMSLSYFPLMAPKTDSPGARGLSLTRYPYKIYSEIEGEEAWILDIRDARRQPRDGRN